MKGKRKMIAGLVALVFLSAAFAACVVWPAAFTGFGAYATSVVSCLTAVVAGNVGEHFAARGQDASPGPETTP